MITQPKGADLNGNADAPAVEGVCPMNHHLKPFFTPVDGYVNVNNPDLKMFSLDTFAIDAELLLDHYQRAQRCSRVVHVTMTYV